MINISLWRSLMGGAFALACASVALGHIRIAPDRIRPGRSGKVHDASPEREASKHDWSGRRFPAGLRIYDFEFKPGWKIDFKKDENGKIVGAIWTGKVQPYEFVEFGMLGINPKEETNLVWKFVQYYEDGTKEEFTGPVGSFRPSPVTVLKKPEGAPSGSK